MSIKNSSRPFNKCLYIIGVIIFIWFLFKCSTVLGSYAHFMWEAEEVVAYGGEMKGKEEESAAELTAPF